MHTDNYGWFITQAVESMLPRFSSEEICLKMIIDASWVHYEKDGQEESFKKSIMLVFYRPNNYTKVLFKDITDDRDIRYTTKNIIMEQLSDHDSCWRTDGMNWIFQLFQESWEYFDSHNIKGRDIQPSFHFSIFNGEPEYRKIDHLELKDHNKRYTSDYIIKLGPKIKLKEISKFMQNT